MSYSKSNGTEIVRIGLDLSVPGRSASLLKWIVHFEIAAILIAFWYCFGRFDSEKESSRCQVSTLCEDFLVIFALDNKILKYLYPKLEIRLVRH